VREGYEVALIAALFFLAKWRMRGVKRGKPKGKVENI